MTLPHEHRARRLRGRLAGTGPSMSEQPERPAQPGAETSVPKDVVAEVQAALDATFNARGEEFPDSVEAHLREQLEQRGVASGVTETWVMQAAGKIAAGEPVVAEPGDA